MKIVLGSAVAGAMGIVDDCTARLRTEMQMQYYRRVIWQAMSDGAPSAAAAAVVEHSPDVVPTWNYDPPD